MGRCVPIERNQIKGAIAARVARELHDGDVINLGIGLPTLVPSYLPEGVHVILHSENGIIGTGPEPDPEAAEPFHVTDAGGKAAAAAPGGCFIDSSTSFGLIRGGHVDCTILGALEVDQEGNLANWIIPGKKLPGMGGAMDLVVGARRVIVAMEHTSKGSRKILNHCRLPITAARCVNTIITEMGVMEVTPQGLELRELGEGYTVEMVQQATECPLIVNLS